MNHLSNLPMDLQLVNSMEAGFEPSQCVKEKKEMMIRGENLVKGRPILF